MPWSLSSHQAAVEADEISSQYSVPAFNTGFNEEAILTSEGNAGAATVNVSSAASGVPEAPVTSSATVRSPGCPSNSAAKSTPVKIASDAGVNAAATSRVTDPKGVVLLPTTQPDVNVKLSPAPRFEKITSAFAGAIIPAQNKSSAPSSLNRWFIGTSICAIETIRQLRYRSSNLS